MRQAPPDEARFLAAFEAEIAHAAALAPGRTVSSVFFGGGTPSLMKPATVGAILDAIGGAWAVAPGAEVTLEANPTSVEATRFSGYRKAGVKPRLARRPGAERPRPARARRMHTAQEALAAVAVARTHFERYSFDLIYARPGHAPAAWAAELKEANRAMPPSTSRSTSSPSSPTPGSRSCTAPASS